MQHPARCQDTNPFGMFSFFDVLRQPRLPQIGMEAAMDRHHFGSMPFSVFLNGKAESAGMAERPANHVDFY
ncbi:hypothetical protein [Neisseria leonii]|uniref:hypothetical protein n=1 Tax=Neisseria leonii TaxID=2995413 RepID=UPI00237B1C7C|nr:hypothetical protein [Neisseria sp. 3986]MDD9325563.1 hypothetical protein [Neisseria sp. 3986]